MMCSVPSCRLKADPESRMIGSGCFSCMKFAAYGMMVQVSCPWNMFHCIPFQFLPLVWEPWESCPLLCWDELFAWSQLAGMQCAPAWQDQEVSKIANLDRLRTLSCLTVSPLWDARWRTDQSTGDLKHKSESLRKDSNWLNDFSCLDENSHPNRLSIVGQCN